jgi:hypothetical protein
LFLWHFTEEVEHRSSALVIYDAVVGNPWYRMRVAPSAFKHAAAVMGTAAKGFNKHVPLEDRKVDAMSLFGGQVRRKGPGPIPYFKKSPPVVVPYYPIAKLYPHVQRRELWTAAYGVVRSQIPGHNPAHQKLPALAAEWLARYDSGYDVTRWYSASHDYAS